jgi:hypothetical protein
VQFAICTVHIRFYQLLETFQSCVTYFLGLPPITAFPRKYSKVLYIKRIIPPDIIPGMGTRFTFDKSMIVIAHLRHVHIAVLKCIFAFRRCDL